MRVRPLRPHIYRPLTFAGVLLADVKYILAIAGISYSIPFFLDLTLFGFPLAIPATLINTGAGILFFNWARKGRRANWLNHMLAAWGTRAHTRRRTLPADWRDQDQHWLIDEK